MMPNSISPLRQISVNTMTITFTLLGLIIILFIILPLAKTVFSSSPAVLFNTLLDDDVRNAIWLSLYTALIATLIGTVFGVPLAYVLARFDFPGKRMVEALIDVPIVIPHAAAGIALLFVFGHDFLGGKLFSLIGVTFVDSIAGIVIAMLFVSIPFLINSAKEGFKSVDIRLERVSRTLGASPWQTFLRVSLPLAWRSILVGNIMMWARGISEFGAVMILAYHPMVASILIADRFEQFGLDYAVPVAALLIMICLAIFIGFRTLACRGVKP